MSKNILLSIIGGIAVVAIAGILIFNPFTASADKVNKAFNKTFFSKSFKQEGELGAQFTLSQAQSTIGISEGELVLSFSKTVASQDSENPQSSSEISLNLTAGGMSMRVAGEMKVKKDTLYFKVSQLPPIPLIPSSLGDQWFKVNLEEIQGETPTPENIDQTKIVKEIESIFKEKNIFDVKKSLGKEEAGKHFLVGLNKKATKEIVPELVKVLEDTIPKENQQQVEQKMKDFKKNFEENFEETWKYLSPLEFEVWIDNGYITKFKFQQEMTNFENTLEKLVINLDLSMSEFGKDFTVEQPGNAKSLQDLNLKQMFAPTTNQQQTPTPYPTQ